MKRLSRRLWAEGRLFVSNRIIANVPSHTIRLWFYRAVMRAQIGTGSSIFMNAWFDTPGGLIIGNNSTVNQRCRLDSRGGLIIGSNVSISADVLILTADHDIQSINFVGRKAPVIICNYAFIGTRALILPGVTLGEGAVVGAGSVVTKNVAPYTVVAGAPAKKIGHRNLNLDYTVKYRRLFQ